MEPPWTLTGGAALAGYHLGHRTTQDLDLFWHGLGQLDRIPREVEARLTAAGLACATLQTGASFTRLRVTRDDEVVIVDLVAEPVARVAEPEIREPGIEVDAPHEILVNKLNALVSRSEVRDLEDVRVLIESGLELERALADAPKKDGGFSPMTLAWVLERAPLADAERLGFDGASLAAFRDELVARLVGRRDD